MPKEAHPPIPQTNFPKRHMKKALILFMLVGISSWVLFSPYVSKIREVKQKIRRGQIKLEKLAKLARRTEEMEKKFSLLQKDIQYLDRYLPSGGNSVADTLRSKGKGYGLNMFKVDTDYSFWLETADSSYDTIPCLKIIPFNLYMEGQLPDICLYFEWLEGLPYFFGIDNVEISKSGEDLSPFPVLQVKVAFQILGLSHQKKDSIRYAQRQVGLYHPFHLSLSLINTQKNLRLTALEKDLFTPEQVTDGYVIVEGGGWPEEGSHPWKEERGSLRGLSLTGIVNYQGEYIALINNQRVRKGDSIEGMEVVWITKDSICLAKGSRKIMLNLNNR